MGFYTKFRAITLSARLAIVAGVSLSLAIAGADYCAFRFADPKVFLYCSVLACPLFLAGIVTWMSYQVSGYNRLIYELFIKRKKERDARAGLAFVRSESGSVLLNRQTEAPYEGLWLPLGGYFRPGEDRDTRDTAERRVEVLTSGKLKVRARIRLAYTKDNLNYKRIVRKWGHAPIHDDLYSVEKDGRLAVCESDVMESDNLKWWKSTEIEKTAAIPDVYKDILTYLAKPGKEKPHPPVYWDISIEWYDNGLAAVLE